MVQLPKRVSKYYRKFFGRYDLEDPRPIAKEAPYTYYLPSQEELAAIEKGDLVKLIFLGRPKAPEFRAERMWVLVTEIHDNAFAGTLDNDPADMPQLQYGDRVDFQPFHIIDISWADEAKAARFAEEEKQIWDRCLVDRCVIDDGVLVHYLYREDPDLEEEDDKFPDSGWRIRGDYRHISDAELDDREVAYVAMGLVLNVDDSWLHLIDEPIGSEYIRDFDTGEFGHPDD